MKILLFGKNGQVGHALERALAPLAGPEELVALDRSHGGDLAQLDALAVTVRQWRPQVIVNAAAYTAVDKAESEPDKARLINALAPEVLAKEAQVLGAWLLHYSTDYVFDGSGNRPWLETDANAPLNVYGQTKLEGERLIQAHCTRHLIFRTSWVYAAHGSNFAKTMLKLAQERERLTVIDDQWGAPTGAELLANVTAKAISQISLTGNEALAGLYHLAPAGETTWHQYASHVIGRAKALRPDLPWLVQDIAPVPSSAFVTAALRPHNSRLDIRKLQAAFGIHLSGWQQGVDDMLAQVLTSTPTKETS